MIEESRMEVMFAVFKRELECFFLTPLAYVFTIIFLMLSGALTFYLGGFFERGQADLQPFFNFHPWLYLFLVPAVAMRIWAEERKTGSIELLFTLPVSIWQAVVAKFMAAWVFLALSLSLTFPIWITVNVLGDPDNGVIFAAYLGSLLMAGTFLAIGSCISAITKSQVIAFVLSVVVCFLFLLSGLPIVLEVVTAFFPIGVVDAIAGLSFMSHFDGLSKGAINLKDVLYFMISGVFWLSANVLILENNKGE
jgi:ABC-2 type transport system permease protein